MSVSKTVVGGSNPPYPARLNLMLGGLRVHYKFRFMIKIKDTKGGLEIHKVAPVFTQLGLEDGLNIDDLVREFFTVYLSLSNVFLNFSEFYIMLDLIIWRSTNMSNTVYIRP